MTDFLALTLPLLLVAGLALGALAPALHRRSSDELASSPMWRMSLTYLFVGLSALVVVALLALILSVTGQ